MLFPLGISCAPRFKPVRELLEELNDGEESDDPARSGECFVRSDFMLPKTCLLGLPD